MTGKRGLKGQVTMFVIVGIVILAVIFSGIYVKSYLEKRSLEIEAKKTATLPQSVKPVKLAIDLCIKETAEEAVRIVGLQGGYITLPDDKYITNVYNDFSNKLQIFPGLNVPYWYYESASGAQKLTMPSLAEIGSEIENYIDATIIGCVEQAKSLSRYGYDLVLGTPKSKVYIKKGQDLNIKIDYPMTFKIKDEEYEFSNFDQSIDIDFYSIYDAAKQIFESENENNFLEDQTLNMMVIYDEIPYDSLEFDCVPKSWLVEKVTRDFKDILYTNIPLIHVKDTSYTLAKGSPSLFEWNALSKKYPYLNVNLLYSQRWPYFININPNTDGILRGEPISDMLKSQEIGLPFGMACMTQYHFIYDLKYPVLIMINDPNAFDGEGYTLQYATQVIIKNNQPKINTALKETFIEESLIDCNNANIAHKIYVLAPTINEEMVPIENAEVSYKCITTICNVGQTKKQDDGDKYLDTNLLPCVNGLLTASKSEFNDGYLFYSSNEPSTAYITIEPYYKKDVLIKIIDPKKGIREPYEDEEVIFNFETDDYFTSYVSSEDRKLNLIAGNYKIKSTIIRATDSSITLPPVTREVCSTVPQSGIFGLFGATEERCETIEVDDIKLDQVVAGGANFDWYASRFDLSEENKLILYTYYNGIPTSAEGLTNIQQKIESNSQEPGFEKPRFVV